MTAKSRENCKIAFAIDFSLDKPLYTQIKESIINAIKNDTLQPGDKLPTVRQLSSLTKISYSTISKAIQELCREGFISSKPSAGIKVNEKRFYNSVNQTGNIGIIGFHTIEVLIKSSPFFGRIFNKLQDEVVHLGFNLMYNRWNAQVSPLELFNNMSSIDGLFVLQPYEMPYETLLKLGELPIPVFVIGELPFIKGISRVFTDNFTPTVDAVTMMIKNGCRRIAFVSREISRHNTKIRYEGYLKAIKNENVPFDKSLIIIDYATEGGKKLIKVAPPPDGIFVADGLDRFSQALPFIQGKGLTAGRKIIFAGFDDNHWEVFKNMKTPYITINQDTNLIARDAVKSLFKQLTTGKKEELIMIPSILENHLLIKPANS